MRTKNTKRTIAIAYITVSLQYDKSGVNLLAASICNVLLNAEILYNLIYKGDGSLIKDNILIETKRLRLVPMTFDFVLKLIANDSSAYEIPGAVKTETWPEDADIRDILHLIRDNLANISAPDGFDAWLFISNEDNTVVGDGGFKGAPDEDGVIDMRYFIIEAQRKRGYGFEAVSALLKWALAQKGVKTVTADCLEDNIPSIKILSKLGMHEIDKRDGLIFYSTSKGIQ